jgi:hypothetical protein
VGRFEFCLGSHECVVRRGQVGFVTVDLRLDLSSQRGSVFEIMSHCGTEVQRMSELV